MWLLRRRLPVSQLSQFLRAYKRFKTEEGPVLILMAKGLDVRKVEQIRRYGEWVCKREKELSKES